MRILIAIKGCHRDAANGNHQVVRDTWLSAVPRWHNHVWVDSLFFMGRGGHFRSDEAVLDCPDDYQSLPHKTKAITAWAAEYDFIYLCDVDTLVMPDRLLGSGFQHYDYMGGFNGDGQVGVPNVECDGKKYAWASGGPGYWLSAKAARIVAASPVDDWAEDRYVGNILGPYLQRGELKGHHSLRYYWGRNGRHEVIDICLHYSSEGSRRAFDPEWMRNWWKELHQL